MDSNTLALKPEDLDDLQARTAAILHYQKKAQELAADAERCQSTALYLQESLTLWLERQYNLDLEHEQWHLDLPQKALVRKS